MHINWSCIDYSRFASVGDLLVQSNSRVTLRRYMNIIVDGLLHMHLGYFYDSLCSCTGRYTLAHVVLTAVLDTFEL